MEVGCRPYGSKLRVYRDRVVVAKRPVLGKNATQAIPMANVRSVKYSIGIPLLAVPWLMTEHDAPDSVQKARIWLQEPSRASSRASQDHATPVT